LQFVSEAMSYHEPLARPPVSAPPNPPAGESDSLLGGASYGSYQQNDGIESSKPQVTNYNQSSAYSSFGDATLRPNTGEDNWIDEEIMGLALHEILKTLQWSNILACSAAIVLEIAVCIFRIFSIPRLVLGCYLGFFASLLLRIEIAQIVRLHRRQLGERAADEMENLMGAGGRNAPDVQAPFLRDNFGILFHPTGKTGILSLMATMCWGQTSNWIEFLLGCIFALNALVTMYIICRYPGYRQQEDIPVPTLPPSPNGAGKRAAQVASWSYYENNASSLWMVTSGIAEHSAMLTSSSANTSL
jgi:hypothetical protein